MITRRAGPVLFLLALAGASALAAQKRGAIPAPTTPPPEVRELDSAQATIVRTDRATRETVLARLSSINSAGIIAAPEVAPPDVKEEPIPMAERERPSIRTLLDRIRALPGGPALIQDARRRGAKISTRGVPLFGSFGGRLPSASDATETAIDVAATALAFSVSLTPANHTTTNPNASMSAWGTLVGAGFSNQAYWYLCNCARPQIGSTFTNPYIQFKVTVPTAGWYILDFEAAPGNKVSLWRWNGSTYASVSNFDFTGRSGVQSYPALLELAAGTHYFYLVANVGGLMVYEANAFSLQ